MRWFSINECLPSLHENWCYSSDVLVTDGKHIYLAHLFLARPFEEDVPPYFAHPEINLKGITHWRSLPALPQSPSTSAESLERMKGV